MEKFYFIKGESTEPAFNIASEEYLLKEKDAFYIYVWRNAPAVIVGVNQNTLSEINVNYLNSNGIKLVRRITGGGAVYHDLNNICYTVIAPYKMDEGTFKSFSAPLISFLKTLGITAEFSGRNDVLVDGKKISGTAETVYKDRIMHHGTLLFDTDFTVMQKVLNPDKIKTESKGIKSVKSRVTNIKNYLGDKLNVNTFMDMLSVYLKNDLEEYFFSKEDLEKITKIKENKYDLYDWNYGYSPKGNNEIKARFSFGTLTLHFDLMDGKIENAKFSGDFFLLKSLDEFYGKLNGKKWQKESVSLALLTIGEYIRGATKEEILSKFFE